MALDPAGAFGWRFVGPHRGGRVMAVLGDPSDPRVAYCGASGGGVWKTADGGASWHNLSDPYFKRGSVGALAMAASDPAILYAGMGECGFRANVTHGDGVYRSEDGGGTGCTWVWPRRTTSAASASTRATPRRSTPPRWATASVPIPRARRLPLARRRTPLGAVLAPGPRAGAVDLAIDPREPARPTPRSGEAGATPGASPTAAR